MASPSNVSTVSSTPAIAPLPRGEDSGRPIGAILVDAGKLTIEDAERVMRLQKEKGMRFGDAAVQLGLLKDSDIQLALARQFDYPYLVKGENNASDELVAAFAPFSPQVEALRGLRSQLMLRWFSAEAKGKALTIVSPARGEGRSYIAANLAIIFSQLRERTLLIDADMRHPRQHVLFQLDNRTGLSAVLAGHGDSVSPQRVPHFVDLSVLTAGATPPNPQELMGRPGFSQMLEKLGTGYDVILIDTPAGNDYADAHTLASLAGGALMVTRRNHTGVKSASHLSAGLRQLGANLVGSVLSEF